LCLEKLKNRSGIEINVTTPTVPYRETARRKVDKRVRHRKQSGGHGEFGEVHLKIAPRARGEGFLFIDKIHGGVVPRQYIPAVEAGIVEAMNKGPLGSQVVDVEVTLIDGKYHSVDSSEFAFRKAGAQAMREALSEAMPVLLEPINKVTILVPNQYISGIQKLILGHRGQIFGFDAKSGWIGWDEVSCKIPAAGMQNLIMEIRSVTMGVGTFIAQYDHLQELNDKDLAKATG
jgi:elongation factor G